MFLNMTAEVEKLSFVSYLHDKVRSPVGDRVLSLEGGQHARTVGWGKEGCLVNAQSVQAGPRSPLLITVGCYDCCCPLTVSKQSCYSAQDSADRCGLQS